MLVGTNKIKLKGKIALRKLIFAHQGEKYFFHFNVKCFILVGILENDSLNYFLKKGLMKKIYNQDKFEGISFHLLVSWFDENIHS